MEENERVIAAGGRPARSRPLLLGITEAPPAMQAVRDELSSRLRPRVKKLRIAHFVVRISLINRASLEAVKARRPDTISYSTQPNAQISVRASTWRPSSCSGAM